MCRLLVITATLGEPQGQTLVIRVPEAEELSDDEVLSRNFGDNRPRQSPENIGFRGVCPPISKELLGGGKQ